MWFGNLDWTEKTLMGQQKRHSQKDRQNEKSEDYVPDEGTR